MSHQLACRASLNSFCTYLPFWSSTAYHYTTFVTAYLSVSVSRHAHNQQTSVASGSIVDIMMFINGTTWGVAAQVRLKKQRVRATQRPCRGLSGLWQVARALHGAGAECAPALEMLPAPPSSEVSASTGDSHTPLFPPAPRTSPPPLSPSQPPLPPSAEWHQPKQIFGLSAASLSNDT